MVPTLAHYLQAARHYLAILTRADAERLIPDEHGLHGRNHRYLFPDSLRLNTCLLFVNSVSERERCPLPS
jgi:hypothetical protein